jgi:hypothetical protein
MASATHAGSSVSNDDATMSEQVLGLLPYFEKIVRNLSRVHHEAWFVTQNVSFTPGYSSARQSSLS